MGSVIGSEPGADVIQASGHASWADLVWVETSNTWRDNTLPPTPVSNLTWSEAVPLLLMLAGSFAMVYASLHLGAEMLSITIYL